MAMNNNDFRARSQIILGEEGLSRLAASKVAVYGLGGVGAAAAIDLVRAGVGTIMVRDFDTVSETNLNRLVFGFIDEIGRPKTAVFADWARRINPSLKVHCEEGLISGELADKSIMEGADFHIDCIDTLNPKVNLIAALLERELPFISALGTAGRIDPLRLRSGSLWESSGCPLARCLRNRLRKRGFGGQYIEVIWSDEPSAEPAGYAEGQEGRPRRTLGSLPFVPQAAGHALASRALIYLSSCGETSREKYR